ncbi:MAG: hypothetical protein J6O49_11945 [Bacteroidaceae bacterium]|nr:hypothetical protein [Bacteroidaceae bacterium]
MKRVVLLFFMLVVCLMANTQEGKSSNGYRGYVDIAVGDAYNFNTDQQISTNNMQWYTMVSTTHGYVMKNWFLGAGVGYYHSYRDKENMYPIYAAGRYIFENTKIKPYIEARAGIMYDPYWIEKVQKYGALSAGVSVYNGLQVGIRGSVFSRPSRYFTANVAVNISYTFGK